MEAPVIIDLPSTTTSQVNNKLVELRQEGGATTLGRVLNLVIVTDDGPRPRPPSTPRTRPATSTRAG